jgi:ABC-2 type transport system permease protein
MFIGFLGLFVMITLITSKTEEYTSNVFKAEAANVAIIDRDNSQLSKQLSNYINSKSRPVEVKDDDDIIRDALFFETADYILIIPKGFGDAFLNGENMPLESLKKPQSVPARMVDVLVNGYLATAQFHLKAGETLDYPTILKELEKESAVSICGKTDKAADTQSKLLNRVNYMAYPIAAMLTFGIGSIMFVLSNKDIRKRASCSPVKMTSYNFQIFLGNTVLAVFAYIVLIAMLIIMLGKNALTKQVAFMYINMFMFTISMLSLAFLFGNIVTNRNTVNILANCVSLGISFLGGVYIPYEYLSDTVRKINILNPAYWCVKSNIELASISNFTIENLSPLFTNIIIQLCYSAAFIAIALLIYKQKRTPA